MKRQPAARTASPEFTMKRRAVDVQKLVLTVGGLGLIRVAPGTFGSLVPVVLALALAALAGPGWMFNATLALLALAASIACVRLGTYGERLFGRKDAAEIVADEVAGQCIALLFLPWRMPVNRDALLWNGMLAAMSFAAFRLFDITKPPPARGLQRLSAGWGVLVDDLIAGLYALAAVQVVLLVL